MEDWVRAWLEEQRRNSRRYETRIHLTDHFFYHKRLIHAGKREVDGK